MDKKNNSLRAAAVKQLYQAPITNSATHSAEELLYELQVHQIELEMQNENLRQSNEALAELQQEYFELYEFAPSGYLTLSHQGLIEKINLTGATLLGKNHSQLLQRRFAGFINATDADRWHLFFTQVMRGNDQKTLEVSLKQPNGNGLHVQLHCLPMLKADKQPTLWIALTNITESKQAEQQLRNNEAFTHSILNSLSAQIAVLDTNGTIVAVNKAWRQFSDENGLPNSYNYNLNHSYFEQGSPSFQESQLKDAINAKYGISAVLAGTQKSFELEYPCHSPTEQRWFNMRVTALSGTEQGVVVSHENITQRKQAEIELHLAAAMFESDEMMMVTDANSVILKVNQKFSEVTGYSAVEVIGQTPRLLSSGQHDASFYAALWQGIHTTGQWSGEIWNQGKNGKIYPEWITITAIKGNDKEVSHYVATMTDITKRKRLEKSLQDSESKFRTLFDSTNDAIMLLSDTLFFDCNQAALTLFACKTVAEFCIYHPSDLSPLEQPCGTSSLILEQQYIATAHERGQFRFEWTHKRIDTGEIFMVEVLLSALILNEKPVLQATLRDITERKAIEEEIKQLAFFDPLTGLPNRRNLLDRLHYSLAINHRANTKFAVFMMDLDKFKAVNDKLGHAAGDELLKQVAARIINCLRDSDMVARLGGDEFVLVLENLKIPEAAEIIASKVIAELTLPFQLSDNDTVQIGASIGISLYPLHGNTPESLMDHADSALYQAKDNGRGCFAYFSGNGLTPL